MLVSGSRDKHIKLWHSDGASLTEIASKKDSGTGNFGIYALDMSAGDTKVVSGSSFGIKVFDLSFVQKPKRIFAHNGQVHSIKMTHDGSKLISGSSDQSITIRDVATLHVLSSVTDGDTSGPGGVTSIDLSADETTIASGASSGSISVWDASTLSLRANKANAHGGE
eukprot:7237673-Prymnesium_polylepis.1